MKDKLRLISRSLFMVVLTVAILALALKALLYGLSLMNQSSDISFFLGILICVLSIYFPGLCFKLLKAPLEEDETEKGDQNIPSDGGLKHE